MNIVKKKHIIGRLCVFVCACRTWNSYNLFFSLLLQRVQHFEKFFPFVFGVGRVASKKWWKKNERNHADFMTEVKYVEFCVFIEFTFFVLNPFMMIFCVLTNFLSEIISNKTKMAENHTICSFRKSNTEFLRLYFSFSIDLVLVLVSFLSFSRCVFVLYLSNFQIDLHVDDDA